MGFATQYLEAGTNKHIDKTYVDVYHGNLYFSSIHQLKFHTTSRRDDLISLFYMMVYLFKNGTISGYHPQENYDPKIEIQKILKLRQG